VLNFNPKSKTQEREREKAANTGYSSLLSTKSIVAAGIPLLPLQGHPMTLTSQVLFQQNTTRRTRESVPFQINSFALLLCFKPQELNYNTEVKTSSANSSGDVP